MRYSVTYTYQSWMGIATFGHFTWDKPIRSEEDIKEIESRIGIEKSVGHNMFGNPNVIWPTVLCWQRFDEPEKKE